MNYELFISLRYLKARRKQVLVSVISLISILGIALGVTALLVTLSVMNGFKTDLTNKILGTYAHIIVINQTGQGLGDYAETKNKIENTPHILAASPFVYGQIMLKAGDNISGAVIKGIIPQEETRVTDIKNNISQGDLDTLKEPKNIVLGRELARNLGVNLNDDIYLISPVSVISPFGLIPKMEKFKVTGIFVSGMYEYDANLSYVSLNSAQNLFDLGQKITGLAVKTDNPYNAQDISAKMQEELKFPYWVRSWMVTNRNLFSALKLEKIMMFIILVLIVLVAAFNIIATLMIMTIEKTKDIGILKTMGATRKSISRIFILEGLIIGVIGTALGSLGGFVISKLLDTYQFIKIPADVYYLDKLPVRMEVSDFVLVAIAALVISLLATVYPSYKAGKLDPCEAIRYE
ncbi:MAG: lipoprotein-releasing ABC transporter permease subunit [bacterium]